MEFGLVYLMEIVSAIWNLMLGFLITQIRPLYPRLWSIFQDYHRLPCFDLIHYLDFRTDFWLGKRGNLD